MAFYLCIFFTLFLVDRDVGKLVCILFSLFSFEFI